MKIIPNRNYFYRYSPGRKAAAVVRQSESVCFETLDALTNVIRKPGDTFENTSFEKDKVNPATGPVFIEGAMPGDTLEIAIRKIELDDQAVITTQAGYGVIGDWFDVTSFNVTPIENGMIRFDDRLSIPVDTMVGVMAVTPPEENVETGYLGAWGGNLDNTMMREGATLYLPVFLEGALFACGDVHAVMGDGEINCSAIEAAGKVTLSFTVRKDLKISNPILRTAAWFTTICSEPTLDQASDASVREMALILKSRLDLPFDRISMLMSAIGNAEICQTVSPLKTARFCMPIYALETYGFQF